MTKTTTQLESQQPTARIEKQFFGQNLDVLVSKAELFCEENHLRILRTDEKKTVPKERPNQREGGEAFFTLTVTCCPDDNHNH